MGHLFLRPSLHDLISQQDWPAVEARLETSSRPLFGGLGVNWGFDGLRLRQSSPGVSESVGVRQVGTAVDHPDPQKKDKRRDKSHKPRNEAHRPHARSGRLPLHMACHSHAPLSTISALVRAYPAAVSQPDLTTDGDYPLHLACHNCSTDVVLYLLSLYPRASRAVNDIGLLPIQIECDRYRGPRVRVMTALLQAYPDAARRAGRDGRLLLHWACIKDAPLPVIAALVEFYPEGVRIAETAGLQTYRDANDDNHDGEEGNLPLYLACDGWGTTAHVISLLLHSYPPAAQRRGGPERDLPLHLACGWASPHIQVVQDLLTVYPNGARKKDVFGRLPLHRVMERLMDEGESDDDHDEEEGEDLSARAQDATLQDGERGGVPFGTAAARRARKVLVQNLLDVYPDGGRIPDENGRSWSRTLCFI